MRQSKSQVQQSDLLMIEKQLNHLWGELNTINLSNKNRSNLENRLAAIETDFKKILEKNSGGENLAIELDAIDLALAQAAIEQAEQEISKAAHTQSTFQALENMRKELAANKITPSKARHELKAVVRKSS